MWVDLVGFDSCLNGKKKCKLKQRDRRTVTQKHPSLCLAVRLFHNTPQPAGGSKPSCVAGKEVNNAEKRKGQRSARGWLS